MIIAAVVILLLWCVMVLARVVTLAFYERMVWPFVVFLLVFFEAFGLSITWVVRQFLGW